MMAITIVALAALAAIGVGFCIYTNRASISFWNVENSQQDLAPESVNLFDQPQGKFKSSRRRLPTTAAQEEDDVKETETPDDQPITTSPSGNPYVENDTVLVALLKEGNRTGRWARVKILVRNGDGYDIEMVDGRHRTKGFNINPSDLRPLPTFTRKVEWDDQRIGYEFGYAKFTPVQFEMGDPYFKRICSELLKYTKRFVEGRPKLKYYANPKDKEQNIISFEDRYVNFHEFLTDEMQSKLRTKFIKS